MIPSNLRAVLASVVVYAAATAAMGRHLLASPSSAIAADAGDPMLNAAILAWNARRLPWTDGWFNFPAFYPATNTLTFSEHLLGVSVIGTPLNWLIGDAVAAYNLTLLAGYVLSGLAMFALVKRVTGSAAAAFIAGTAYAFAPYRAAQLSHIQVGIAFWAPLALLGLHAYLDTGRRRWLALFGVCWLLQGAANLYFLVYFSVLVGLWVLWFVIAPRRWREVWAIAATLAVAALPLLPIVARYTAAHQHYGLSRPHSEIVGFSADIAALLCASSHLDVWGSLQVACRPEGELFPGITIVLLCILGLMAATSPGPLAWFRRQRTTGSATPAHRTGAGAVVLGVSVLLIISVAGPWEWPSTSVSVSSSSVSKPLSQGGGVLLLALLCWFAQRRVMRGAAEGATVRTGALLRIASLVLFVAAGGFVAAAISVAVAGPWEWSPGAAPLSSAVSAFALLLALLAFALLWRTRGHSGRSAVVGFYILAALATWVLAWGPSPVLEGNPALPQGPYAWLMVLPGVDGLRVPARFWMMTTLCLSVLAGFASAALLERRSPALAAAIIGSAAAGFLIDGWSTIPTGRLLSPPPDADALRGGVALTLPLGDNRDIDIAAQFAAVTGGYLSVNGFSGYESSHYDRLRQASRRADPLIFASYRARGDLHVIVSENASSLVRLVEEQPGTSHVATADGWRQYRMAQQGRLPPHEPSGERLKIAALTASCSEDMLPLVTDRDHSTRWQCGPQRPEQQLTIDLGSSMSTGAVVPALGRFPTDFPRRLRIETSVDGREWIPAWEGGVLAELMEAEFFDPAANRLVLSFAPRAARYVRLGLIDADDVWYWSISELEVWSGST